MRHALCSSIVPGWVSPCGSALPGCSPDEAFRALEFELETAYLGESNRSKVAELDREASATRANRLWGARGPWCEGVLPAGKGRSQSAPPPVDARLTRARSFWWVCP